MATLTRVIAGFGLGVISGTVLGAISGYWGLARRLLDPTVQALRAIPSIAWVPLFILWLGIFETSKIALIAVGVFFPVYLGVMGAILSVDRKMVEVGRTFRLSGPAMIRRILLPAVLPAYVVALRVGLGLGWMFVVAAEFMGASEGLGYLLIDGQQLGKPAQILAAIVIFAILGKTTDWLIEIGSAALPPRPGAPWPSRRGCSRRHRDLGAARKNRHHLSGAASAALAQRRRQYRFWSIRCAGQCP